MSHKIEIHPESLDDLKSLKGYLSIGLLIVPKNSELRNNE